MKTYTIALAAALLAGCADAPQGVTTSGIMLPGDDINCQRDDSDKPTLRGDDPAKAKCPKTSLVIYDNSKDPDAILPPKLPKASNKDSSSQQ